LLLVEKIKARRRVLGIGQAADEKAADGGFIDLPQLAEEADDDLMVEKLTEKALAQLDQKAASSELSDEKRAAMAQQADAYLQGAVAQIVFEQAVQAIPDDLEFRQGFISVLSQFADMTQLRQLVLDSIQRDFAADAEARAFLCTVHLGAVSAESPELVDALQRAAAGFKQALGALDTPAMWSQYIAFLAQWRETCTGTDSLRAYLAALLKRAVAAISDNRDTRLSAELALACASELESSHGAASMELLNWLADATQRFSESAELWHRRLAALIAASHDGTVASGAASLARIDSLFSGQALPQAAGSRALWDLWFDWTEQCFGRGQVSVGQVQSRFISAFARVTQQRTVQAVSTDSDGMARLRALLAHLQVRYVDWAWGLPAGCSLSEAVELAHDDSDSEPDSDERMEPQTAGNLDAVRQAYRNVSRQAFPTPGFYRRCIELETDVKQQTMLHEMACRVDAADTQPWLAYLAHLVGLQQLTQASQVYWRASKSISEDQQPAFAAAYQAMFSS
ncbi:U3 snoRNP protein, partial [Coemansia sp. RSA 2611]